MVEACLWDWVGTLRKKTKQLDKIVHDAIYSTLSQRGNISYEKARSIIDSKIGRNTYTQIFIDLGLQKEDLWDALRTADTPRYVKMDPKLTTMFNDLSDYRHTIVTSLPRDILNAEIEKIGIPSETFDYTVCSNDVSKNKPHPEPFLKAVKLLKVKQKNCVMIGDRHAIDIVTANKLGMETIEIGKDVRTVYDVPRYLRRFK